ncbi:PfkB family carbohydrate kinase, partial [Roseisolibacter sp. H3M3-2]|uniref:PfkB family carbohydrate kinase n=1 Tax=Roseisolibacter sp. H3M3-2 TaxID=3031323 RepID=UPI0023DC5534
MRERDGRAGDAEILCVGELLWDALPAGLFLGGAPFNVACHLRAAGQPVAMVSRVGDDRLGDEALRRAAAYGVATDLVQRDPSLPTGFVRVALDAEGGAAFEILAPAAWDAVAAEPALLRRAASARAIVFGTLAQRAPTTRRTVERLLESSALLVFDANLRPPHVDPEVVRRSLARASIVKLTERELRQAAGWFGLAAPGPDGALEATVADLAARFDCGAVAVTRGREGSALWHDGRWTEQPGFAVEVRDTVGSGDAFLAVLLAGLLAGGDDAVVLQHASLAGAYVATQPGAVPPDQGATAAPLTADAPPAPRPSRPG